MTRYEAYENTIHFGWIPMDKYPFFKHIFHPQQFCLAYRQYIFDPFVKSVYDNLFFMYYNFQFLSLYDFRWKRMIH